MERNEGNVENTGGNVRNGMRMRVRRISVGMPGIRVEILKMWGIRVVMQEVKVET